jgi:mono/diheme cytochrome c family protein
VKLPTLAHGCLAMLVAAGAAPQALAATPAELLAAYTAQAKAPASSERGQRMFSTNFDKDFGWSCASCHGELPTKAGKHASSGKPIEPLAPAANRARFTDKTKVEFHFRMNCQDVVGRECTAGEKADLLSWLLTLKP